MTQTTDTTDNPPNETLGAIDSTNVFGEVEKLAQTYGATTDRLLAALEILAEQDKIHMVQVFILFHPSPEVVATAATYFADAGREAHEVEGGVALGLPAPRVDAGREHPSLEDGAEPSGLFREPRVHADECLGDAGLRERRRKQGRCQRDQSRPAPIGTVERLRGGASK